MIVPKPNGTTYLNLVPLRLNQALIRSVHRGSTINDIMPKLKYACYITLINASSGYYNLKWDKIILLNHIGMSVWQEQIHKTAIQSCASG